MKRATIKYLAVFAALAVTGEAAAEDALERQGTPQEQHAQAIFAGVFAQCRAQVSSDTSGLVAIVFTVGESGKFGATSTLNGDKHKDALRVLASCMGERANKARPFPAGDDKSTIGVKYEIAGDGKLLKLGVGETRTLEGGVFEWARQRPDGGNS